MSDFCKEKDIRKILDIQKDSPLLVWKEKTEISKIAYFDR